MKIALYNRQKTVSLPKETTSLIEKAAKLCVKEYGFKVPPCEACITLIDNAEIRRLNNEHRGIDTPTDVLSFPLLEYSGLKPDIQPGDVDPDTKRVSLGDILVSVEKAVEQANSYGHCLERELAFLVVHGMLHLLGYDHMNADEEKNMFEKQEQVLSQLGVSRN